MLKLTHSGRARVFFDALLVFCYATFIYWLSVQPQLPAPMWFLWQDKLYHGGAYFVLGVLVWRFVRHCTANLRTQLLISLLFCSFYGLTDEWHQHFVPERSSSIADWLADTVGAAVAMIAVKLKYGKIHHQEHREHEEKNV